MPDPLSLAISTGEPAGIGPDITIGALLQLAGANHGNNGGSGHYRFHVLGDARLLAERAAALGVTHAWERRIADGDVVIEDIPLAVACDPGRLDARNGPYVLALLDAAIAGCLPQGRATPRYAAMVTAPVQKSTINDAGVPFTGHTEYLADSAGVARVVMMLAGPQPAHDNAMLRVALEGGDVIETQISRPARATSSGRYYFPFDARSKTVTNVQIVFDTLSPESAGVSICHSASVKEN